MFRPFVTANIVALLIASTVAVGQDHPTIEPALTLRVGLQGYSPVSYIDNNKAEPGSPRFSAEHEGITYFFTKNAQRQAFVANPAKYEPAYGGYCAYGCAVNGLFTPNPESFKIIDGKINLFIKNDQVDTLQLWNKDGDNAMKKKADGFWAEQTQSRAYLGARNLPASGVALDGYSPVSYFTVGKAEKGDPQFQAEHNGATYYFTTAQQQEQFKANPERYEPAYGGWCAFGMAVEDKFPVDPTSFKIVNDRLLLFLNNKNVDALKLWNDGNERELHQKANAHWKKVSK